MVKVSKEKFKTYEGVFDQSTLRTLFKLASQGYFDELKSPISQGKESQVYSAVKKNKSLVVVKIYLTNTCNFNKMYDYIYADPRFIGLQKNRRKVVYAWAKREYANLFIARKAGVDVPTPYAVKNNVLVMEFIGDKNPSRKLKDHIPGGVESFFEHVVENIKKLYKGGLVHADLSEYNILNWHHHPVFIDLSHGVKLDYPHVDNLLRRDVRNVCKFFSHYMDVDFNKVMKEVTNGI